MSRETDNHIKMEIDMLRVDVDGLIKHRHDCDAFQIQTQEYNKRSDDAINNLTQSNIILSRTMAEMNATAGEFIQLAKETKPVIKLYNDTNTWYVISKKLTLWIVGFIVTGGSLVAAFHQFF